MDYKTKIKYGEELAEKLLSGQKLAVLKEELLAGELYEKDVQNVVSTAFSFMKDKIGPKIQTHLLAGTVDQGVKEFEHVDGEVIEDIIKDQLIALGHQEKLKVANMMKEKKSHQEIYAAVDNRFYPNEVVAHQLQVTEQVQQANSGGSRTINIGIGAVLCAVGIGSYFTGVFWYGLIIVGLGFIGKGLFSEENPYD